MNKETLNTVFGKIIPKKINNKTSSIIAIITDNNSEIISIATGSKTINKLSIHGDIINDSHAEILAKRSLQLYLWRQLLESINNKRSIFTRNPKSGKYTTNSTFNLYISTAPCGEASNASILSSYDTRKRKRDEILLVPNNSRIIRGRSNLEVEGYSRTKPGRSDCIPCESMSCSDKIAKWKVLGVTGALLGLFIDGPILITTLDIAEHYDKESLERCINRRSVTGSDIQFFHRTVPKYPFSKSYLVEEFPNVRSSDIAVYWAFNPKLGRLDEPVVTVNGHKQGAKKRVDDETPLNPKTICNISKQGFFKLFQNVVQEIVQSNQALPNNLAIVKDFADLSYRQAKNLDVEYKKKKTEFEMRVGWIVKDGKYSDFKVIE